jgi:two-component system, sensor histidine kinase and response regulator
MDSTTNRRILIVDDNADIHRDFRKVLLGAGESAATRTSEAEAALFGDPPTSASPATQPGASEPFELESAMSGEDALAAVQRAIAAKRTYAMAFIDVRMPPGWDGVETTKRLWQVDPDLQVVICTAYSDYTWPETVAALGRTDRLLILKKPFDPIEACQLASALTEKWNLLRRERRNLEAAIRAEREARAYAASLETVNRALESSWAKTETELAQGRTLLLRIATDVLAPAKELLLTEGGARASADRRAEIATSLASVVELASLHAGTVVAERVPCSPASIVREVADAARSRAASQIDVKATCGPGVPGQIESDPAKLRRIVEELVANALRHTRRGTVAVELSVVDESGPAALAITVSDTGGGVSRGSLARLFEPFTAREGEDERSRVRLGLAVSKHLATLLGAKLRCTDPGPPGARFRLVLPFSPASQPH